MNKLILFCMLVPSLLMARNFTNVKILNKGGNLSEKAVQVFQRIAKEKANYDLCAGNISKGQTLTITLQYNKSLESEAYDISALQENSFTVEASDDYGLMYGLGKVLHSSYITSKGLDLGDCKGSYSPDKSVRGIYLATHFHNFYNDAPIAEVKNYIEELALWGYNALQVWFDMHHYTGIKDPKAVEMISRLKQLLAVGRDMGMKSGLTMLANESYSNTPQELRSHKIDWTGFYGCEICPSAPGGTELILKQRAEMLDVFANIGLDIDNVWLWPYDQGGCSCEECSPWGANGYLKLTKQLAQLFHQKLPSAKIILSTWLFDFEEHDKGEWRGLAEAFSKEKPWVDGIMADSHTLFPRYLLNHPVPGNLPLLNFPEISMWENLPWGGYGANPQPLRFERLWREMSHLSAGGYPYSEGKFEDFNKVLYSQFYWKADCSATDVLKQYISYEFSPRYADKIADAILIIEKNMGLKAENWIRNTKLKKEIQVPSTDFGAKKAYMTLKSVNSKLPTSVQKSWRWRIIYLRSFLDYALRQTNGKITPEINAAFKELTEISRIPDNASWAVRPPYILDLK